MLYFLSYSIHQCFMPIADEENVADVAYDGRCSLQFVISGIFLCVKIFRMCFQVNLAIAYSRHGKQDEGKSGFQA